MNNPSDSLAINHTVKQNALLEPHQVITQFRDALCKRGIIPPQELIADGDINRCDVDGKNGKNDGAYLLHLDELPAGGFENHRDGKGWENWRADVGRELTPAEEIESRAKIAYSKQKREAETNKRQVEAQSQAIALLNTASPAADNHPYLLRKKVNPYAGIKYGQWHKLQKDNCLLIPMHDCNGEVWNVQAILPENDVAIGRDKDFLFGGRKKGLYFAIGRPESTIYVCEGLATGASIHEATGCAVAVAFDAGNLGTVVEALKGKYPSIQIIIAADNDCWKEQNTGKDKAEAAAKKYDCKYFLPSFKDTSTEPTDFNDLHCLEGLEAVRKQLYIITKNGNPEILGKTIHLPLLQGVPIPERKWVLENWILKYCVTALYGDGGVGKSLLLMQFLTCVAAGLPFLGINTSKMKGLGFFCEDTEDELHRRQADINAHYKLEFTDLQNMQWQSRVGCDNVLMNFVREGVGCPTAAYNALRDEVIRVGAQLVVIDTAADTFGGNENIRPQVRQFINLLAKLALEIDGAVILSAHPSAAGMARNDGTGGSTAWNATVRSRIYLSRPITASGEELSESDAKNLREFTKMKSNYSTIGDKFILRWDNGVFHVEEGQATDFVAQLARKKRDKEDDQIFLTLLDQLTKQGRVVSESKNAGTYAPKIMTKMDKGKAIGAKRFAESMARLFDCRIIDRGYVGTGKDRKKREGVRRCETDYGEIPDCGEVPDG